jgi:hypothetical protein
LSLPSPGPRFVFTPSLTRIRGWIPQPGGRKKVRLFHIFSFDLFVEGETVITRLAERNPDHCERRDRKVPLQERLQALIRTADLSGKMASAQQSFRPFLDLTMRIETFNFWPSFHTDALIL